MLLLLCVAPEQSEQMSTYLYNKNLRINASFNYPRSNQEQAATDVWRTYRNRGDAENRIKELKADFGADSFNLKGFFPTEAALIFSMIAYNLMSIFRLFVLQEKNFSLKRDIQYKKYVVLFP